MLGNAATTAQRNNGLNVESQRGEGGGEGRMKEHNNQSVRAHTQYTHLDGGEGLQAGMQGEGGQPGGINGSAMSPRRGEVLLFRERDKGLQRNHLFLCLSLSLK